jgi:hypothetical protein
MEIDFSGEWSILGPGEAADETEGADGPAAFAARELASVLERMTGRSPALGSLAESARILVLDAGKGERGRMPGGRRRSPRFSWRASSDRVELYGEDGSALLQAVYDFLRALGARWPAPGGEGESLPHGERFELELAARSSENRALPATLILGHAVFLQGWRERFLWAARSGYSSIFIHTSPESHAMGAIPGNLYEAESGEMGAEARRLGLGLELGGHWLSSFLPRGLFKLEPALFREKDGRRLIDHNFCVSSERALELVSEAFASWAASHPEVSAFHAWPDDLPGGGHCSCPLCASLSPSAQSLKVALALASSLERCRPDAALSLLAYHDTEDIASALAAAEGRRLPPNLELLWAPRRRCWGHGLGEGGCALNAASLAAFRRSARAWREAGGGRVAVFEYWEDAVLFKGAVPPLVSAMRGDIEAYRGSEPSESADALGILCTGGRLPLAPRPNLALLPRLASAPPELLALPGFAEAQLSDWARSAYGEASGSMLEYWRELEAAWAMDLELEEGETELRAPEEATRYAIDPPADWGDPWAAGLERLSVKRERCEALFEHLRGAERSLAEAGRSAPSGGAEAVKGEAAEYAISGAVLELNCARLAVYHELAGGDPRAAADIANLALSASGAVRKALRSLADSRARREIGLLVTVFYDLRLKALRRANARSGIRRLLELWLTSARLAWTARRVAGAYSGRGIAPAARRR